MAPIFVQNAQAHIEAICTLAAKISETAEIARRTSETCLVEPLQRLIGRVQPEDEESPSSAVTVEPPKKKRGWIPSYNPFKKGASAA